MIEVIIKCNIKELNEAYNLMTKLKTDYPETPVKVEYSMFDTVKGA